MPEVPSCLGAWCWSCGVLASLCPSCLRAWVLGAGVVICSSGQFVPEVPSCLGAWCWQCVLVVWPVSARGAFVPGCLVLVWCFGYLASSCPRGLRAWVLGAGYVLCYPDQFVPEVPSRLGAWLLVMCLDYLASFVPEVPSCLGAWCWHYDWLFWPLCARGAFVPGCLVLAMGFLLTWPACARGAFVPGCLGLAL